ncbi:efflux RND transporter periplasmic adaptor subunit [Roseicyclus marinus]|uniref:efflux RND transporter periplasmic adaptor subunit n=1 Tax=Roseicyclus marinus TaxID=2161673 RepID=UPI00240EBA53|nr:efflux RND transporter periplasmic adaptor subunit [Roseicyclus marinus]MDG3040502.1 efflux RND transporter periplasmic adaptor subunit [Roseicyclus marinus]
MHLLRQSLLALAAIVIAVGVWAVYVPAAAPYLARIGVYDLLGLAPPTAEAAESGRRGFGGGAVQVVVAPVGTGQANARVSAIGDGRALRSVTVRSDATGMIRDLAVSPGSWVEVGALVAQLDDDAERIALERARLMVMDASRNLDRLRQLSGSGAVSAVQIREAELALRTAELGVEQAEFDLSLRRITAPISGWAGLLEVAEGDRISTQDTLAILSDRSSLQIDFRVPERFIGQLSIGMPVEVTAVARPDHVLSGEIVALDNVVDRTSRTLRVQAQLDNADDSLRAGQAFSVTLSFPGDTLPSVDPLAIQWSGDGAFVWAARDGQAVRVPVTIRQRNADSVLVEAEIAPGDLVIIEGVQTLRPGADLQIVEGAAAPAPAASDDA